MILRFSVFHFLENAARRLDFRVRPTLFLLDRVFFLFLLCRNDLLKNPLLFLVSDTEESVGGGGGRLLGGVLLGRGGGLRLGGGRFTILLESVDGSRTTFK